MKKLLSLLAVTLTALVLLSSCENADDENSKTNDFSGVNASLSDLKDTAWFSGETEISFPYENETLYINYMPDPLNTEQWISLKENADGTFTAKIEWSKDVREIGKTSAVSITKLNGTISVKCDFFEYGSMSGYAGVTASRFDVSKVPPLQAEYLSNFSGKYTLNEKNYELSVGAKLGMSASVINYWNANVLNAIVRDDGAYDMLLAHSSSNNGSSSIDPGITGSEPFVSKQGLFWNHLVLTQEPGSKWTVEWSSDWYDSPYEALNAEMNMKDTFTGPATTKITYKFNFWFGNAVEKNSFWTVETTGEKLYTFTEELDIPTDKNWKQILEAAKADGLEWESKLPEEKTADYWWYGNTGSYMIRDSYEYKLFDRWTPALYEYDFYLALKDKPVSAEVYYQEGHFKNTSGAYDLTVTSTGITYNGTSYSFVDGAIWSFASDEVRPLQYCYVLTDGTAYYYFMVEWYTNNKNSSTGVAYDYVNMREPKITEEENPVAEKGDRDYTIFGTRRGTLKIQ